MDLEDSHLGVLAAFGTQKQLDRRVTIAEAPLSQPSTPRPWLKVRALSFSKTVPVGYAVFSATRGTFEFANSASTIRRAVIRTASSNTRETLSGVIHSVVSEANFKQRF
jgi:hypothetical protein